MGRYTMTEAEAEIKAGTEGFMNSLPERRAKAAYGEYEPYWHYSERQHPYSEFNEDSLSSYMWHKWGVK